MPIFIGFLKKFGCLGISSNEGMAEPEGIRTLDTALQPYNGLANRRLQPLGHSSIQNFAPRYQPKTATMPGGKGALLP